MQGGVYYEQLLTIFVFVERKLIKSITAIFISDSKEHESHTAISYKK
jgi:hypothetical protein